MKVKSPFKNMSIKLQKDFQGNNLLVLLPNDKWKKNQDDLNKWIEDYQRVTKDQE